MGFGFRFGCLKAFHASRLQGFNRVSGLGCRRALGLKWLLSMWLRNQKDYRRSGFWAEAKLQALKPH